MLIQTRSLKLLSILTALLVFGCANHCLLEDIYSSLTHITSGITTAFHSNTNHYHSEHSQGSHSKNNHDDQNKSHQHGQPHALVVLKTEHTDLELGKLFVFPIAFFGLRILRLGAQNTRIKYLKHSQSSAPPDPISRLIGTLTIAALAPPVRI